MSDNNTSETQLSLSHFTKKPLGELRAIENKFEGDYRSCYEKPKGLWISVDGEDDWQQWCNGNMSERLDGARRYQVQLAENHGLLMLVSPSDLIRFTDQYGRQTKRGPHDTWIDWPAVAERYSGIIIAPYQWCLRMELGWYYGWDCASGCIWNPSAIACIEQLQEAA